MYDLINKQKKERSAAMKAALILTVLFLLAVSAIFVWAVRYELRYRAFVSHLSDSNVYAYENRSFHADVEGTLIWAKSDNVQDMYNYILFSGKGRTEAPPEGEPAIVVEYGDGGFLSIYRLNEGRFRVHLFYEHRDGFSYSYSSSKMTVETFAVNFLALKDNAPWPDPITP